MRRISLRFPENLVETDRHTTAISATNASRCRKKEDFGAGWEDCWVERDAILVKCTADRNRGISENGRLESA